MPGSSRAIAGAQAGRLLLAAGVFTLINNYLPGSEHLDIPVLDALGIAASVLGLLSLFLPWIDCRSAPRSCSRSRPSR